MVEKRTEVEAATSNARVRTTSQTMRAPARRNKETNKEKKLEMLANASIATGNGVDRRESRREKKISLEQDVDKLRKKLRQEESVHRALERAFTRPLGALPRLPPHLPSHTLELLAEVAVLEEEVVRLEEQVVNFRQDLYQEAIFISTSKKSKESVPDKCPDGQNSKTTEQLKPGTNLPNGESLVSSKPMRHSLDSEHFGPFYNKFSDGKRALRKQEENNQWISDFSKNHKKSPVKKVSKTREDRHVETQQPECLRVDRRGSESTLCDASDEVSLNKSTSPNRLSEDILKCLMTIFLRTKSPKNTDDMETSSLSSCSCASYVEMDCEDPYDICNEFDRRDIGPYKHFRSVEVNSNQQKLIMASSSLKNKLKSLLRRLDSVDISNLTHWQKLAFWINIYNSCMMNAFLEQGIPTNPQMVAALMAKAVINVGGHLLSAMTIEHFILRLPYHMKIVPLKGLKNETTVIRSIFGLEWPDPLVTFALSCGSWSSPAVRVYTAAHVEEELEAAKKDYLQASVAISKPDKVAIPKLLDWYQLDFAKDIESLVDWICLQLPSDLRAETVKCVEMGRCDIPHAILVLMNSDSGTFWPMNNDSSAVQ